MDTAVVIEAKRSAIGKLLGGLSDLSAVEIGAQVALSVLGSAAVSPKDLDEVIVGQVLQAGAGQNPARQVALKAGVPETISAVTVNKVCGSGLQAVMQAAQAIRVGDAEVVLAGGIESMTNAPYLAPAMRKGARFGDTIFVDVMQHDGLNCAFEGWAMGCAAEHTARQCRITRQDQDAYAIQSHQRAANAAADGAFQNEIVPIEIQHKRETVTFTTDEIIRPGVDAAAMAKLPTVFEKDGTVTPGNASAIADGAALAIIASEKTAKERGWPIKARIRGYGTAGVAPRDLFIAPIDAIKQVCAKAGWSLDQVDLFEINEAFASQMLACICGLELDPERVNVNGGGIALGHPIGASGARCLTTLLYAMAARSARKGVVSLCLGGGNAVAMAVEC